MTNNEIVDRIPGLRQTLGGWRGPCPSCGKRRGWPLSVRSYSDGSHSVKCFYGCDAPTIMRSVGLELRDLFPNEMFKMERKPRGPTSPKEIRDALRKRYDELVEEGAPQTTATVNAARRSISIRFGLKLAPLATRLHEGYAHDADPLWPALFRYAADHALRAFGSTLTCDDRERLGLELPVRVRIAAEEAAARELRRIGQEKKAVAVG